MVDLVSHGLRSDQEPVSVIRDHLRVFELANLLFTGYYLCDVQGATPLSF